MFQEYFDESHQMIRDSVQKFLDREVMPYIFEWEENEEFPRELYKKAADAGFFGLGFPEELGGVPGDRFHTIALAEAFVRSGSLGLCAGLFSWAIGLPPILFMGNDAQRKRFIPPVLAGDKIAALAVTEPNAGSDVANIQTRAVRDGDHFIVNGSKMFITSGCRADIVTTIVRTGDEGHGGIGLIVIEKGTPGFSVAKNIKKMGWRVSDTAELVFEDCRVPAENLLEGTEAVGGGGTGPGGGFAGVMQNFQGERIGMAIQATAVAQLAYEEALKYAQTREAFGKTLMGFQVTRHKLADMATKIAVSREFNYRVAAMDNFSQDPRALVSMAKLFACEVCDKVVFDAVQIHGGYGFAREYLVERLYRDSRIMSLGGGTSEIMKEIISKALNF